MGRGFGSGRPSSSAFGYFRQELRSVQEIGRRSLNVSTPYEDKLVARGDLELSQTPEGARLDLVTVRAYHHARNNYRHVGMWRIIRLSEEAGACDTERRRREP